MCVHEECVCVRVPKSMALPAHTADAPCMYSRTSLVAASWRANREQPVFCLVTVSVWLLAFSGLF